MRLAVCVPARNQVEAGFANDLAEMYALTRTKVPAVMLDMMVGTFVHQACERLLEEVTEYWAATHVLWLDTDMRFPADTAVRLLRHDVDVVAANCTTRVHPPRFVAQRDGCTVPSGPDDHGLEVVDSVGMAVLLMKTSVLAGLPRPWFWYGSPTQTADFWFCDLLRAAGRKVHIDHDLSKEIGHIGQYTFRGCDVAPAHNLTH